MNQGLYEELVTKLINYKINELDKDTFQVKKTSIDKVEAAQLLSQHIGKTIKHAFSLIVPEIPIWGKISVSTIWFEYSFSFFSSIICIAYLEI